MRESRLPDHRLPALASVPAFVDTGTAIVAADNAADFGG